MSFRDEAKVAASNLTNTCRRVLLDFSEFASECAALMVLVESFVSQQFFLREQLSSLTLPKLGHGYGTLRFSSSEKRSSYWWSLLQDGDR